jgi:hypothetical protein
MAVVKVDNQPISSSFFGEGHWLTDFITPESPDVQQAYRKITSGILTSDARIEALHHYVGNIKYKQLISGMMSVEGRVSYQRDLWNYPATTMKIGVGNCANKAFLLASLMRQELPPGEVYVALGNLYNEKPGGHAWVVLKRDGTNYIVESTRPDVPTFIDAKSADRYEPVHFFNDLEVFYVEGKSVLEPYTASYSTWLKGYLDWSYIDSQKLRSNR